MPALWKMGPPTSVKKSDYVLIADNKRHPGAESGAVRVVIDRTELIRPEGEILAVGGEEQPRFRVFSGTRGPALAPLGIVNSACFNCVAVEAVPVRVDNSQHIKAALVDIVISGAGGPETAWSERAGGVDRKKAGIRHVKCEIIP